MATPRPCETCRRVYAPLRRGLCSPCYLRVARRHPGIFTRQPMSASELLGDRTIPEPNSGCVLFLGSLDPEGYGHLYAGKTSHLAHRLAYEVGVGPIPKGLTIDHLCRNRACVNPTHLEPVTSGVNTLRGFGSAALNARRTQCNWGHPFDDTNTYRDPKGRRGCRACRALAAARHRERGRTPCQV